MRIQGRILRPSNLSERRVLKSLGVDALRVCRGLNPFMVARHVHKLAAGRGGDLPVLRELVRRNNKNHPPQAIDLPDSTPLPRINEA